MALIELLIAQVLRVPQVVSYRFQIGGALTNGVLVEAVEARLVDNIDDGIGGLGDGERRVACSHFAISLY